MFGRRDSKTIVVVAIATLFVMAFAYSAFAFSAQGTPYTYSGKVMAIDNGYKTVTIQAGMHDQRIFKLNDNGVITRCNKPVAWSDLKVGDQVKVSYFERSNGNFIANTISLQLSGMERC